MSEPEKSLQDFLRRWSRRKLAKAERDTKAADARAEKAEGAEPKASADAAREPAVEAFDLASLPPIESINAASDIRAFLAPGVPVELTRAALRRAWVSDPAIRDFVGLAENQWDFTQPGGVPGFDSLDLSAPALRQMAMRLLGEAPAGDAGNADAAAVDVARSDENAGKAAPPDRAPTPLPQNVAESPVAEASPETDPPGNAVVNNCDFTEEPANRSAPQRKQDGALLQIAPRA